MKIKDILTVLKWPGDFAMELASKVWNPSVKSRMECNRIH